MACSRPHAALEVGTASVDADAKNSTAARLEVEGRGAGGGYQQIAPQATHLRELKMSNRAIVAALSDIAKASPTAGDG